MIDKFESWLNIINEKITSNVIIEGDVAENPTVSTSTEVSVSSDPVQSDGRKGLMSDVDAIMTSLDALSVELKESLNEDLIDKAAGAAGVVGVAAIAGLGIAAKKAYDFSFNAPKAKKAQDGVNKLSIKIAGIEAKLADAKGEMKDKIKVKIDASKEQRDSLQSDVDAKWGDKSTVVKKALALSRKEGKIAVLNITMGNGSPKQQADTKAQLAKLKTSIVQDQADFIKSKPSKEAKAELDDAIKQDKKENPPAKTPTDNAYEKTIKDREVKNKKDGQLNRVNDMIAKEQDRMDAAGTEESPKLDKLKKLMDKISAKESWQIEGTELGRLFEMEISKLEADDMLTESISIRERFSKLI